MPSTCMLVPTACMQYASGGGSSFNLHCRCWCAQAQWASIITPLITINVVEARVGARLGQLGTRTLRFQCGGIQAADQQLRFRSLSHQEVWPANAGVGVPMEHGPAASRPGAYPTGSTGMLFRVSASLGMHVSVEP